MNCVTWGQAQAYCRAQGKRLPGEWEWVWAALGGTDSDSSRQRGLARAPACWRENRKTDGTCEVGSPAPGTSSISTVTYAVDLQPPALGAHDGPGASWDESKTAYPSVLTYWHDDVEAAYPTRNEYSRALRRDDLGFRCVR